MKEDFNKTNFYGLSPLFAAVEAGDIRRVTQLLDDGAAVMERSRRLPLLGRLIARTPYAAGSTPLHAACLFGHVDIAALLLARGADVNAENVTGHRPIDSAILSYQYYLAAVRRAPTRIFGRFQARRLQKKCEALRQVISALQAAGAKPGLFALPAECAPRRTAI